MATIWTIQTPGEYSAAGVAAPAYLSRDEAARWTRLQICRALFEGRHREFFLDNGNTQFNYREERVNGRVIKRYSTFNLMRLVSIKTADLLFGGKTKLDAPSDGQTEHLDALARRSLLHSRLHTAATQASWAGGAFLVGALWRGEPYVEVVEPDALFPIGDVQPDGQFAAYRHYATTKTGSGNAEVRLLLTTTYETGVIRRELAQLDEGGAIKARGLDLAKWPRFAESPPLPEERTGITRNTVVYMPNQASDQVGVSDYDGLIGQQDAVNAKYAQVARVLAIHAEPKLRAPTNAVDTDGNFRSDQGVVFTDDKDAYGYITWDGQLDAAMKDRDAAVDAFCIAAEMSQVLLGIQKGATPDAARKLRLEATNSLAKVGRKALLFEPAIAMAIEVTQQLDQASPLLRSYPIERPGVHFRDGLPVDGLDLATEAATWRAAGLMSVEDGVSMRVEDPDAAFTEIERLTAERAAAMPTVLMGGGAGGEVGEGGVPVVGAAGGDEAETAVSA